MTTIVRRNRFDPLRVEVGKIGQSQHAVVLFRELNNLLRKFALVESVPAPVQDDAQTSAQFGHFENITLAWGTAVDQTMPRRIWSCSKAFLSMRPLPRNDVGDRKPLFRIFDRWSEDTTHGKLSVALVKLVPTGNSTGNRDRIHSEQRYVREAALFEKLDRSLAARPPAAVQTDRLAVLLHVNESKHVTANSCRIGFHDVQDRSCRYCCVNRIASFLQDAQGSGGSERLARRHHSVHSKHGRTGSTRIRSWTITVTHRFLKSSGVSISTRIPGASTVTSKMRSGTFRTTILAPWDEGKARIS